MHIRSGSLSKSSAHPRFPASIGWTHYLVLLRITNPAARAFYELEATRERWTVPQLERQITALLFERLTKHRTRTRCARSRATASTSRRRPT
jgi:predicted nuclease of restriction endonuclease-like (RecB) superfamily